MFTAVVGTLLAAFLTTVGWLFRRVERQLDSHENRITILETRQDPLQEYIKIRFDDVDRRLTRIETSMDHKEQL